MIIIAIIYQSENYIVNVARASVIVRAYVTTYIKTELLTGVPYSCLITNKTQLWLLKCTFTLISFTNNTNHKQI